ncbi:MAG: DNA replication initiation control protein YabA [Chloroflexi bacterium]|nr:DNA replication initiation control protein YabA [Chloroflexota bacterium]
MIEKETNKRPDPEVNSTPRRRFSAQEKLRILEEAEACTEPGEVGALVRREGIYFSYLSRWRRARDRGQLEGLKSKKRGPKKSVDQELGEENVVLRQENERLRSRLQQAEMKIDVQKKLSQRPRARPFASPSESLKRSSGVAMGKRFALHLW